MKLVTIRHQGHRKVGAIRPGTDRIWLLEEMLGRPVGDMLSIIPELDAIRKTATFTGEGIAASDIRIEAPIPRPARNVFCVGKNYHEHAREFTRSGFDSSASSAADAIPTAPIIFTKAPECVVADGDDILYPTGVSDSPWAWWRMKSWAFSSRSRCEIAVEIEGWEMWIRSEARVMLPVSPAAMKYSN